LKNAPDAQKLRGGYYTPKPIADFLARWAIRSANSAILEPSLGDGNIIVAAAERLRTLGATPYDIVKQITGVELDPGEAKKAICRVEAILDGCSPQHIYIGDFFDYAAQTLFEVPVQVGTLTPTMAFDAIVGNPPFIRYQNFPEELRSIATRLMEYAGFKPNRLMNTWLPFLIISSYLLNGTGRIGMVLPAELFQVNYAAEARQFLSNFFPRLGLITFEQLVFPNIQQEVVLLLAEKEGGASGIRVVEMDNLDELATFNPDDFYSAELKEMNHSTEKWTQYFLSQAEISLLREMRVRKDITRSGDILDVDVGIVTGQNDFFIVTKQQARTHQLEPYLERIVSRSAHLRGVVFSGSDWFTNVEKDYPVLFFCPPEQTIDDLPVPIRMYIQFGESQKYHTGYKCRIRSMWYIVPSVWIPDAFMLRQVHAYPKLVLNNAQATCTDTIHRVRFINGVLPQVAVCAFHNSLTFAFSEVTGRSYGGGVLTFEPSEAERLPIPLRGAGELDIQLIDTHLRNNDIEAVLNTTDRILLTKGLNLSEDQVQSLRGIWRKLKDRRINRKLSRRSKAIGSNRYVT
jgi:adenine-specific DNA-methyltransferase